MIEWDDIIKGGLGLLVLLAIYPNGKPTAAPNNIGSRRLRLSSLR